MVAIGWSVPSPDSWLSRLDPAAWLLVFVLAVTWAADTFAYLAGRSVGKHRMAPVLSPGKTWEGAAGGLLGAVVIAGLLGWLFRFPLSWSLAAGTLTGVIAPLGDLVESALKREIGVKDLGNLLPGHGGTLDRFDSLLFTAPVIYFLVLLWGRNQ